MPDPHPATAALGYRGVAELAADLGSGALTSVDLVRALAERIAAADSSGPTLSAVLALAADALDQARVLDAERADGYSRGPLHGVPVLVKDNIEAVGLPGSAGSLALAGRTVNSDAPLVARLRSSGAIVLGSTNLSEWANFRSSHSVSGWSAVGGLTGNPWALDRSAGGSSSGSGAAVAAGFAPLAIGTETNGSITCPAALNGVVGLKPTVGSVPADGVVPISASQDVPGPLARSIEDVALAYEVVSGRDDLLPALVPEVTRSLRVGIATPWMSGHAATDALTIEVLRALEPTVATITDIAVPAVGDDVMADQIDVLVAEMADDLPAYLARRPGAGVRTIADIVTFNNAHAEVELAHFGQDLLQASAVSPGRAGQVYRDARRRNVEFARDACLGPAFDMVDVLVAPAYAPAWKSDLVLGDTIGDAGIICTPFAILGWPILTVPLGLVDGLPVGLAIAGPAGSEAILVAVGLALESTVAWAGTSGAQPTWRASARG